MLPLLPAVLLVPSVAHAEDVYACHLRTDRTDTQPTTITLGTTTATVRQDGLAISKTTPPKALPDLTYHARKHEQGVISGATSSLTGRELSRYAFNPADGNVEYSIEGAHFVVGHRTAVQAL